MNLYNKNGLFIFFTTITLTLLFNQLPKFTPPILFFSPFLVILFYQKNLVQCLWWGILCGLVLDTLSNDTSPGIFPLTFTLVILLLFPQKKYFFADSLSTLPIMTFSFSALFGIIQLLIFYTLNKHFYFTWMWVLSDLIFLPLCDAIIAFIWLILPSFFFGKRPRKGKDYFLNQ